MLAHTRPESLTVDISLPGWHWEPGFADDEFTEIERYRSVAGVEDDTSLPEKLHTKRISLTVGGRCECLGGITRPPTRASPTRRHAQSHSIFSRVARPSSTLSDVRYLRPRWLDLLLIISLVLLFAFLRFHGKLQPSSPWLSLWPNAITDFFAIWLGARIIDGVVSERQRRRSIALGIRGTMNYTMQRARDLLPQPTWALRTLRNEIRWLEKRLKLQGELLRNDERERALTAVKMLEDIIQPAVSLDSALRQVRVGNEDLNDKFLQATTENSEHISRWQVTSLNKLENRYNAYRSDPDPDAGPLAAAINEARNNLTSINLRPDVLDAANAYIAAIEVLLNLHNQLQAQIDGYVNFVRGAEMIILDRHGAER